MFVKNIYFQNLAFLRHYVCSVVVYLPLDPLTIFIIVTYFRTAILSRVKLQTEPIQWTDELVMVQDSTLNKAKQR